MFVRSVNFFENDSCESKDTIFEKCFKSCFNSGFRIYVKICTRSAKNH